MEFGLLVVAWVFCALVVWVGWHSFHVVEGAHEATLVNFVLATILQGTSVALQLYTRSQTVKPGFYFEDDWPSVTTHPLLASSDDAPCPSERVDVHGSCYCTADDFVSCRSDAVVPYAWCCNRQFRPVETFGTGADVFFSALIVAAGAFVSTWSPFYYDMARKESDTKKLHRTSRTIYIFVSGLLALCLAELFATVIKVYVRNPRPNSLALWEYTHTQWVQAHEREELQYEAFVSFPSGHATCVFAAAVFAALIVNEQQLLTGYENMVGLKTTLAACFFVLALYISASRIHDYWHHPADVVAGGLVGTLSALLVVHTVMKDLDRWDGALEDAKPRRPQAESSVVGYSQ